jgi:hypothetical protein
MKKRRLAASVTLLALLSGCCLLSQLQPLILASQGAVDGSFGLRPTSHACLGLSLQPGLVGLLPYGELQFQAGAFSFLYRVEDSPERSHCLGQDIWFGE